MTLLTGDRVTLRGVGERAQLDVVPARGRDVTFQVTRIGDDTTVIPSDALALVANGRLDRGLFNVTKLIEAGYDDAGGQALSVIATYGEGAQAKGRASLTAAGGAVRELAPINGSAVALDEMEREGFWKSFVGTKNALADGVEKLWLDGVLRPSLDQSAAQIGAPEVWQSGVTGTGVKVAVVDSGIDATHLDLAGQVAAVRNFTAETVADAVGHGTHVASTIASNGPTYKGIANGAKLIDAKVCRLRFGCAQSAVISGLQWAAVDQQADIVNISLGGDDTPGLDPVEQAVNNLSAQTGALFVVSAGSSGAWGAATIGSPGSADAGPHVAGAAALLAQRHPDWTGEQLKAALTASARPNAAQTAYAQGAGRVDVPAALRQSVVSEPTSVDFGLQEWPHDEPAPVQRTLTYRNLGDANVNLTLTASFDGPNGQPAPAEAVTLSARQLTVPAGGTASITVAATVRHSGPLGVYTGQVVASGAGQNVRTPLAIEKGAEEYDLTITSVDRAGNAPVSATGTVVDLTRAFVYREYSGGTATLRLPPGTYGISSSVEGPNGQQTWIVRPWLVLDKDTTVDVDARTARPIAVQPPRSGAREIFAAVNLVMRNPLGSSIEQGWIAPNDQFGDGMTFGHAGPAAPAEYLGSAVHSQWADAGPNGDFVDSTYLYGLAYQQPAGSFVTTHDYTVDPSQLATVTSRFGNDSEENAQFGVGAFSDFEPSIAPGNFSTLTFTLPGTLTYHLTTPSSRWTRGLSKPSIGLQAPPTRFQPGLQLRDDFNVAPFGPGLLDFGPRTSATRFDSRMDFVISLFADENGRYSQHGSLPGRTALYREGELVAEERFLPGELTAWNLPAEEAAYRLETSATRPAEMSRYATQVEAAWTFRSKREEGFFQLPLSVFAFDTDTDDYGRARAGLHSLRVTLPPNARSAAALPESATVEVSTDDGATWAPVTLRASGPRSWTALVHTPVGAEFVSLRAKATGRNGNTVEQKAIRAYGLR